MDNDDRQKNDTDDVCDRQFVPKTGTTSQNI